MRALDTPAAPVCGSRMSRGSLFITPAARAQRLRRRRRFPGARRRRRNLTALLFLLFSLLPFQLASVARGDVNLSLPLEGHYREGRYMPVQIHASDMTGNAVVVKADGALPTHVQLDAGKCDGVAPLLAVRAPIENPRWETGGAGGAVAAPLKPLGDDERLVGFFAEPAAATVLARELFPGKTVVPVALDPARKPLSPAIAYAALDLAVLDDAAARQVTESQLSVLLSGGTTVAIRSDARPGGAWPWQRRGDAWVLRSQVIGPVTVVESGAYLPTYGWARGWPARVRQQAALGAIAFVIVALAASLWRGRGAALLVIGCSLLATGAAALWAARQSPVQSASGTVIIDAGPTAFVVQSDAWRYASALRPATASLGIDALDWPMFESARQFRESDARLVCGNDGSPIAFDVHLEVNHTLAVLSRSVRPGGLPPRLDTPVTSPMKPLADQLYPGRVAGQLLPTAGAAPGAWDTVVVRMPPASQ